MTRKLFFAVAMAAASSVAFAQAAQQQPNQPQQNTNAPQQGSAQPSPGGSTGGGAASQQVVVNPPGESSTPPQSPPSSTTVVNPPPPGTTVYPSPYPPGSAEVTVVERDPPGNPMATIAQDAAYGGIAGLLVGTGVALVNEWDTWERDMMIGAGAGLLVGAAVGVAHATYEQREYRRTTRRRADAAPAGRRPSRLAFDGMNRTVRDPVVTAPTVVGVVVPF